MLPVVVVPWADPILCRCRSLRSGGVGGLPGHGGPGGLRCRVGSGADGDQAARPAVHPRHPRRRGKVRDRSTPVFGGHHLGLAGCFVERVRCCGTACSLETQRPEYMQPARCVARKEKGDRAQPLTLPTQTLSSFESALTPKPQPRIYLHSALELTLTLTRTLSLLSIRRLLSVLDIA